MLRTSAAAPDFRLVVSGALRRRVGTGRTLSVDQLAHALGRSRRTVEGWLYGETVPSGGDLAALIEFFDTRLFVDGGEEHGPGCTGIDGCVEDLGPRPVPPG